MSEEYEEKILKYKENIENGHKRLKEIPMTLDLLTSTGIGKFINKLKHHEEFGSKAQKLVDRWKQMAMEEQQRARERLAKSLSPEKESSPETEQSASRKRKSEEKPHKTSHKNSQPMDAFAAMLTAADNVKQPVKPKKMKLPSVDEINDSLQKPYVTFEHFTQKSKQDLINSEELDPSQFKARKNIRKVYAGRRKDVMIKKEPYAPPPTLKKFAMDVLQNNIDTIGLDYALYYVYAKRKLYVPYDILEPVLEKCNATQLTKIEDKSPHFERESDELWKKLCHKKFPESNCDEYEEEWEGSWKQCFQQLSQERDAKLNQVKKKIAQHVKETIVPERQTLMTDVVTPRNIRRRQEKAGISAPSMRVPTAVEISKSRKQIFYNGNKSDLHSLPKAVRNTQSTVGAHSSRTSAKPIPVAKKGSLMVKAMKMFKGGRRA